MFQRTDIDHLPRHRRLLLLGALYMAQGLPFGLFVQALPVILRQQGVSLEAIGLSSLLALPWALKFLWAPWLDRAPAFGLPFRGLRAAAPRRLGWLWPLHLLAAAALLGLSTLDPTTELRLLLGGVFLINLLNASQDIVTDGLAVDLLPPSERGPGNGLQVGAYRLGMIVGGALVLVLIEAAGWSTGLQLATLLLLLTLAPLLFVREMPSPTRQNAPARTSPATEDAPAHLGVLLDFLRRPGALSALLAIALYKFGDALAAGMLRPWLVDQGVSTGDLGKLLGGFGFGAGLLGAALGAFAAYRLTRHRALLLGALVQATGVALYVPLARIAAAGTLTPGGSLATAVVIDHLTGGVATVVLFTCMMDACRPRHAGADYTLMASVVVIASGAAQALSGLSAAHLGYPSHFALASLCAALGGLAAVILLRSHPFLSAGPITAPEAPPTPRLL